MNQPNDHDYYRARAKIARDMADHAANPAIAAIHGEFAARYDGLAAGQQPIVDGKDQAA